MAEHKYIYTNRGLFDKEESMNDNKNKRKSPTKLRIDKEQILKQQEDILRRTLERSNHTLGLVREIEDIGIETAKQLRHQGEQLKNTNCNLDKIKADLDVSQRKINGMTSLFKKAKSYLTKDLQVVKTLGNLTQINKKPSKPIVSDSYPSEYNISQESVNLTGANKDLNDMVDSNTIQIYNTAVKLKEIAIAVGQEIEEQDKVLDAIKEKAGEADFKIGCQTKQINELLGK